MSNDPAFQKNHRVPSGLDAPIPILFWEPMEFTMAIIALGLGVVMHMMFLGIALAAIVLVVSRRMRRGAKRGAVPHSIWYTGLDVDPALKNWFPPSWKNDFVE